MKSRLKRIILVLGLIVSLGLLLAFANTTADASKCSKVEINIEGDETDPFIDHTDIRALIKESGKPVEGNYLSSISSEHLEKTLDNHSHILKSEVVKEYDGVLEVNVVTRRPIARIINFKGESFYLDSEGKLMQWSEKHTARVPVFTGNIYETYARCKGIDYSKIDINDSLLKSPGMYGLYRLAQYIDRSEFWRAQVEQVNVSDELELIPTAGDHLILLGDYSGLEEKFNKLFILYKEGLNKVGWNIYSEIDLRFHNQVVCRRSASKPALPPVKKEKKPESPQPQKEKTND